MLVMIVVGRVEFCGGIREGGERYDILPCVVSWLLFCCSLCVSYVVSCVVVLLFCWGRKRILNFGAPVPYLRVLRRNLVHTLHCSLRVPT